MKKPKLKALKALADKLPESYEIVRYYSLKQGKEITFDEIVKLRSEGSELEINEDAWYRENKSKFQQINHFNRLKKAYSRSKEIGLVEYIKWLNSHNTKMNEVFKELQLKQVDENILEIAKKGAKGFWSNLINFLLSFLIAFKKN
jgi:hypothetical protein